jgi:hypothetical protein
MKENNEEIQKKLDNLIMKYDIDITERDNIIVNQRETYSKQRQS